MRKPSTLAVLICFLAVFIYKVTENNLQTLTWDVFGYYIYLPSHFIFPHTGLEYLDWLVSVFNKYNPSSTLYQVHQSDTGLWMTRYPIGLSFLYAPFFLLAHWLSPLFNYPQDGFSPLYQYFISFGTLIYVLTGLIYLRKVLLHYFNERTTALTLIVLCIGSNFFQLSAEGSALTHIPAFAIVAVMLWVTILCIKEQMLYALIIGLLTGLAIIIRPTEGLVILIPLILSVKEKKYFRLPHIIGASLIALIVISPQLVYWHSKTGHWITNSYSDNPGEGLDLNRPHLFDFLFSFRKGWLIYTPVFWFALIGFYNLYIKNRALFFTTLIYFLISLWVISSWTVWWYAGGSYSPRAMMPVYVALALPLACFVERAKLKSWIIISLLILLNIFQVWQYKTGIISKELMTFDYYKRIFLRISISPDDKRFLLPDRDSDSMDTTKEYTIRTLGKWNTVDLDSARQFSPTIDMSYKELTSKPYAWIRSSAKIFIPEGYHEESPLIVTTLMHNDKAYKYRGKALDPKKIIPNSWNQLQMDYITPEVRSAEDHITIYLWHNQKNHIQIENFVVMLYEPI